jgi:hypothetical protein
VIKLIHCRKPPYLGEPRILVLLWRGLQRGAGVRVYLTVQLDFFELRCGPLHDFSPFREPPLLGNARTSVAWQAAAMIMRGYGMGIVTEMSLFRKLGSNSGSLRLSLLAGRKITDR